MGKKNRKAPQFQTNMNIILKNKKTFESFWILIIVKPNGTIR
jgi:hypothetical protein